MGAVIAGVAFVVVLLNGSATLLGEDRQSDFYDLQAHSLLDGRWDVATNALGLEGFHIDGKNYMYFGPWPALLRMPIAALTHELDGRLSQLSMLLAFAVAIFFVVRLVVRTRSLVRGGEPVTKPELWAIGAFVLVSGTSVLLFLATRLIVFHEAELWGVALALGAFDLLLAYIDIPRTSTLVGVCAFTTAAVLSRATVGVGPVAALGVLALASLSASTRRLVGLGDWNRRATGWLVLAVAIPIVLYAAVNVVKFQTPFGLPFDRQFVTFVNAEHRRVLAANDGSLFGVQFLPTNLLQYLRPDGIRFTGLWPWVRFPGSVTIIGDVSYDRITPTTSVVAAMPLHAVLSVVGLFALVSPRRARASQVAVLRAPVVGAAVGTVPVLVFGFMAQRYLGDFVPLLVLLGAVGLHVTVAWCTRHSPGWSRSVVWAGLALLAVMAIWFSAGLAVLFQQVTRADEPDLRAFVRNQLAVQRRFPGGEPELTRARVLPARAPLGTVVVLGECRGVFVSTGNGWRALERTPATGAYRLRVSFPPADRSSTETTLEPLLSAGSVAFPEGFFVETRPNGRRVLGFSGVDGIARRSRPLRLDSRRPHLVDLVLDARTQEAKISVDGDQVLYAAGDPAVRKIVALPTRVRIGDGAGRLPAPGRFAGGIEVLARQPELCRELTE